MRSGIRPLTALLKNSKDDRTQSNAAGALGNIIKNTTELNDELIEAQSIECLIQIISNYLKNENYEDLKLSAPWTSMFCLGNICADKTCRKMAIDQGLIELIVKSATSKDSALVKNAIRLVKKTNGAIKFSN